MCGGPAGAVRPVRPRTSVCGLVTVSVVQVRIVRVPVRQGRVHVPVRVRLTRRHAWIVFMQMVLIVPVAMLMPDRVVDMLVLMSL